MAGEERMKFVEKWAKFVIEHSGSEWSRIQKELIDAQIENARKIGLTKEQVHNIREKEQK